MHRLEILDLRQHPWLQHGDLELLGPKVLHPVEAPPYYKPLALINYLYTRYPLK